MHTTTKIRMATTKTKVPNPVRTINMEALAMLVMAAVPTVPLETMDTTRTMRTKTETTVVVVTVAISELPDKLVIDQYIFAKN